MSLIVFRVKSTSFSPVPAYKDPIFGLLNSRVSIKAHASSFSWVKFPISVAKRSAVCKSVSFSNTSGRALKAYTRPSSSSLSKKSTEQLHNSELNNIKKKLTLKADSLLPNECSCQSCLIEDKQRQKQGNVVSKRSRLRITA